MRCPVPCIECGEMCELSDMHFRTGLCSCVLQDPDFHDCTHGVCDDCFYNDEDED
jgi:hypothetical protein